MSHYGAGAQSKGLDCCLWSSQALFSVIFLLTETWHMFLGDIELVFFGTLNSYRCFDVPPLSSLPPPVFGGVCFNVSHIWELFLTHFCKYRCITLLLPGKMWGFTCGQKELWSWRCFSFLDNFLFLDHCISLWFHSMADANGLLSGHISYRKRFPQNLSTLRDIGGVISIFILILGHQPSGAVVLCSCCRLG